MNVVNKKQRSYDWKEGEKRRKKGQWSLAQLACTNAPWVTYQ